jgi:long-chain acyl-CoA synthetase
VKPAFFNGVPTLYTAILNHPDVRAGKVDLSSIKLCFSGAAALMAETKKQFEAATGARIIEGYSLTEGMMACCSQPGAGHQQDRFDRHADSDVQVRIVDAEHGTTAMPSGEVGEMILRAPQFMAEYWNNPLEPPRRCANTTANVGCTPAIWPTWTTTASSSSWTARRT